MAITIGKLAEACGVQTDTLRYYEKIGLIKTEGRKSNGYRVFSDNALKQVRFVHRAKLLNFTLDEIKGLLVVKDSPNASCEDVYRRLQKKIGEVEGKIRELNTFRRELKTIAQNCPRGTSPVKDCSLIDFLGKPASHSKRKGQKR